MLDFSLIIPTRNRHEYLIKTVQEILDTIDGIELIISDNSDMVLRHDFITRNSSLKYLHTSEKLSVVDNFERALAHSKRKFVSFIGDDDLVSSILPRVLERMSNSNLDSIFPWNNGYISHFSWPGVTGSLGQLWLRDYDWSLSIISPSNVVHDSVRFPGKGPANLPKIYQGIVSQDVIKRTRQKYGHIFGGVSPDIYSGMLLADNSRVMASINCPFIIPGASIPSTAGEGMLRSDREKNKSNREHIARFGESLEWPIYIPDVYTPHTVWALSMYAAANRIGIENNTNHIYFLYIEMLVKYPEYKKEILKSLQAIPEKLKPHKGIYLGLRSITDYYGPRILKKLTTNESPAKKISFEKISEIRNYVAN